MLSSAAKQEAGLQVYRAHAAPSLVPVQHELSREDALVFSFFNTGSKPFTHLMVFAVDASAEVRWFYPEYIDERADPESIPLTAEPSRTLLPYEVRHDYALGPIKVYALFTHRPLRVSAVEAWLANEQLKPEAPPVSDAKLQIIELTVEP